MPRKKSTKTTPINGAGVSWGSSSKKPTKPLQNTVEPLKESKKGSRGSNESDSGSDSEDETQQGPSKPIWEELMDNYSTYIYGFGVLLLLMFLLFFFVEDSAVSEHRRRVEEERERRRANARANIKEFEFEHATLMNSTDFTAILQRYQNSEEYFDRMILTAFDDSTQEAGGDPKKVKLFKKYEGLAKSMPRKKLFQRYDEEELPMVVLFDCGSPQDPMAGQVCKQLIGGQIPTTLIFRRGVKPRPLSAELRSDKAILQHLFDLLQPAVKYLEEIGDVEDFVADDSSMKAVYFGTHSDSFELVADTLREFGQFGRTQSPGAATDYDMEMPSIGVWRTHGSENPVLFSGNISDANAVHGFVINNYLPVLGEFNERTQRMYMKRGLPIVWVAYSGSGQNTALPANAMDEAASSMDDDESSNARSIAVESANERLFEVASEAARQAVGHLSFVKLDVDYQGELAKNLGLEVSGLSGQKNSQKAKKDSSSEKGDDSDDDDTEELDNDEQSGDEDEDSEDGFSQGDELPQLLMMNQMMQLKEKVDPENVVDAFNQVVGQYFARVRAEQGGGDASSSDGSDGGISVDDSAADEVNEFEDIEFDDDSDDNSETEDKQEI